MREEMYRTMLENKEIIQVMAPPKSYITTSTAEDDDE